MALKKGRVAPGCNHVTEGLSVLREGTGHVAGTEASGEANEAVAKDAEVRIVIEREVRDFKYW